MLKLKKVEKTDLGLEFTYNLSHCSGPPHGTTIDADIVIRRNEFTNRDKLWTGKIEIGNFEGEGVNECLETLERWLTRLGKGVGEKREEITIPI